jgi:hypothetical protein
MRARPLGGRILFLAVQRYSRARCVGHFQQQRSRPAGRIVHGGLGAGLSVVDAEDLRDHPAHLGRRIELTLALATLRGEVTHEVLVGIAQDVVALRAILRKIERLVLEYGDEIGEPVHLLLAAAQLVGVVEVRHLG